MQTAALKPIRKDNIMNKRYLLANLDVLFALCTMLGIIRSSTPTFSVRMDYGTMQRTINTRTSNGFKITSKIKDENMTEEERTALYSNLADQCLKAIKEQRRK